MAGRVQQIDMATWERRGHFELFRQFAYPYWGITTDMDITALRAALQSRGAQFTVGFVYVLLRAVNAVPQFRQRIRGNGVVEHERVDAGLTVLAPRDLFRFATLRFQEKFGPFAREAAECIAVAQAPAPFDRNTDRDDVVYLSAVPWFSFSAFQHPLPLGADDSIPRFAWGRFAQTGERLVLPFNIQAHHALVDAIHIARLLSGMQDLIERADAIL